MSLTPSHAEQEVLEDTLRRDGSSITARQLFAALAPMRAEIVEKKGKKK